ncbi:MAG: hypothetical protein OXH85_01735 [Truepera sp.]|nr:hypothetical protein [Truepera sp.]
MMIPNPIRHCLIWGEDYEAHEYSRDLSEGLFTVLLNSSRTDGDYRIEISREVLDLISQRDDPWKARLTTWLIDQRAKAIRAPLITREIVEYIDHQSSLSVGERAVRLLRCIASLIDTVGEDVTIQSNSPNGNAALAWSESSDYKEEVFWFLNYLHRRNWLEGDLAFGGVFAGTVTVEGYSQIEVQETRIDSSQAFVAMWFDEGKCMYKAYQEGIAPAIRAAGYEPYRIDDDERNTDKIDDKIVAEIKRSRFVVADFTHGDDGARGSVYYEAGFAHGFNIPVIFTCKKEKDPEKQSKLAFDTRQYPHIFWETHSELCELLKDRIEAAIGRGPGKGG